MAMINETYIDKNLAIKASRLEQIEKDLQQMARDEQKAQLEALEIQAQIKMLHEQKRELTAMRDKKPKTADAATD